MLLTQQLPSPDSVAAGKKSVIRIPAGIRLHRANLEIANAAAVANELADIVGDIVVKYNLKPQRTHSAVELNEVCNGLNGSKWLEKTEGTSGAADYKHYLSIWFAEPWRKLAQDQYAMAWNLFADLQIEVNFVSGLASPSLAGTYEFDNIPQGVNNIGTIKKVYRDNFSATGTTRDVLLDKTELYESIHFLPTVETTPVYVSQVNLRRNSLDTHQNLTLKQNQVQLADWDMNPDLSAVPRFDLVFDHSDPVRDALPAAGTRDLKATVTWASAANGTLPLIQQRIGLPD